MANLTCPFLGLRDDPETCKLFPTEHNCCQRAQPVESIALTHQASYCLSAQHFRCPVFSSKAVEPLPPYISAMPRRRGNWRWAVVSLVAFGLAVVLGVMGTQSGLPALLVPSDMVIPVSTVRVASTPTELPATLAPTIPPTLEPTELPTSTQPGETNQPMPTEPPGYTATSAVCFPPAGWVIYTVRSGDTLYALSVYYGVSVTVLQQGNCLGGASKLVAGQNLYVPHVASPTPIQTITPTPLPPIVTDIPLPSRTLIFHTVEPPTATIAQPSVTPTP